MDLQSIKQQFNIIGNSPLLNRGIEIAMQVAITDLSVLIIGESGAGKEHFPKIIHHCSVIKFTLHWYIVFTFIEPIPTHIINSISIPA